MLQSFLSLTYFVIENTIVIVVEATDIITNIPLFIIMASITVTQSIISGETIACTKLPFGMLKGEGAFFIFTLSSGSW